MLERHIFIIGMPGSGKSSLGRKVAANLRLGYVDTDRRIAELVGISIPEIFKKYGEAKFRTAEKNLLIRLVTEPPQIISTGGGMVMDPFNRELMRNYGVILLVDRPLEQILGDIKLDRRPTFLEGGLEEVERVYHERYETYHSAADLILDNSKGYYNGVTNMERLIRSRFRLN